MDGSTCAQLAGAHPADSPGLPRGRTKLPRGIARAAQRKRLQRAAIAAIAERGYAETSVSDIVQRARVSRREFYQHFADKQACFLDAAEAGSAVLFARLDDFIAAASTSADALRHGVRAYLQLCVTEPEFARCLTIELPAAGERGLQLRVKADRRVADFLRVHHQAARSRHRDWPDAPRAVYLAAVGAIAELVIDHIAAGKTTRLKKMEASAMTVLSRLLAIPTD